jgi:hypothetical protein
VNHRECSVFTVMHSNTLALMLPKFQDDDCIVTFLDGDAYEIRDLDIQGFFEDRFEICAEFAKCLRPSGALTQAVAEGYLKTVGVGWTSAKPRTPVSKTYLIEEIESVFDRNKNYCAYERSRT